MRMFSYFILLILINTLALSSLFGQITEENKSQFKTITRNNSTDEQKLSSKFKFKEIKLNAAAIESEAQLIRLKFDQSKDIIRLQDTELIEDDAPAAGLPEGYKSYTKGPVEWVEDLKKVW